MISKIFDWFESFTEAFPPEQPTKPPTTFFGFINYFARPFWPLIVLGGLLGAATAIVDVYLFSLVGEIVDWLNTADRETFWEDYKYHLLMLAALVMVGLPTLKFFGSATVHQGLLGNFAMRTRWQAHRYLLRQSVQFYQDDFAGRVAAKMMQTALGVRDVVVKAMEVFLYIVVYFFGAMVLFASSDIRLSFPMIGWLVFYIIILYYFVPRMRQLSMEQAEFRSAVTGRVVDSYSNINTVKMFANAEDEDLYAREGMEDFLNNVHQQMRLGTLMDMSVNLLNGSLIFSVASLSIWLWQIDAITTGAIAFAMGLVLRLQGMSMWVLWEVSSLFENIGIVQDGIDTISREQLVLDKSGAMPLQHKRGEIRYQGLHFNYGNRAGPANKGIIENLSLTIPPGQKVGLVGRSGAGKSTLVSLLLRFYDLEKGKILIDDQDISNVTQNSLRGHIGMVTQDTSLLHRSVLENICYGKLEATLEDAIVAAKRAHAHEFILGLSDMSGRTGYEAHVGERGVKLSGGQRQRIAIARVLLKDAPILVLDEATSALDSEVEAAIQESLFQLMKGKTVIAIAHRLSTIAAMDRLIVMDEGKIIEDGTHDDLIKNGGLYAGLWQRQSGGFLFGEEDDNAAE